MRKKIRASLEALQHPDEEHRELAVDEIRDLARKGLNSEEISAVIRAASSDLPPASFEWQSLDSQLLRATWGLAAAEHVPLLKDQYSKLTERGRTAALTSLSRIAEAQAVEAFIGLLREHGWPEESFPAMISAFEEDCPYPEILIPALIDRSISGLPDEVRDSLLLAYGMADKLSPEQIDRARPSTITVAESLVPKLIEVQRPRGTSWRDEDSYVYLREQAGLTFDLLGHLGRDECSVAVLRDAEQCIDPHPRMFAILSLLRLGEEPTREALAAVAGDSETRGTLLEELERLHRVELFPGQELDQEKIAESALVEWLSHPMELGRPPHSIELMETAELETEEDSGIFVVYYVFRFRVKRPLFRKSRWFAGIAGPYLKHEIPTTHAHGHTFSRFEPWESRTAAEHLETTCHFVNRSLREQGLLE